MFTITNESAAQFSINDFFQSGWNGTATGTNLTYDWTPGNPAGDGTSSFSGLSYKEVSKTLAFQGTYAHKYSGF